MARGKRPTSFEVARRAGVARSTVSMVLNDVPDSGIPDATRQRVLEAARELGYVPSAAARTLVSGSARTIGLIVTHGPHLEDDAFVPTALHSLNLATHGAGYRLLVETAVDPSRHHAYRELVRAKQIDGVVVLNPRDDDRELLELVDSDFPFVAIGHVDHPDAVCVAVDDVGATERLTRHLIGLGRRRIAHVGYGPEAYESVRSRVHGYRRALEAAGLDHDPARVAFAEYSADSGARATDALLARDGSLDAIVCGNDVVAFGVMTALRRHGRRIPEDVAVVGFDDIPLARHAVPPLTTVRLPAADLGAAAARLLLDWIAGSPPEERKRTLPLSLVVRRSCGSEAGAD